MDVLEHHGGELLVGDLTVTVGVDLGDDLGHDSLVEGLAEGEHLLELVCRDGATAVLVEHLERSVELVVAEQALLVHGGDHELGVVDLAVAVSINLSKHFVDLLVGETLAEVLCVSILYLLLRELAVAVDVHCSEHFVNVLLLLFR